MAFGSEVWGHLTATFSSEAPFCNVSCHNCLEGRWSSSTYFCSSGCSCSNISMHNIDCTVTIVTFVSLMGHHFHQREFLNLVF